MGGGGKGKGEERRRGDDREAEHPRFSDGLTPMLIGTGIQEINYRCATVIFHICP